MRAESKKKGSSRIFEVDLKARRALVIFRLTGVLGSRIRLAFAIKSTQYFPVVILNFASLQPLFYRLALAIL